MDTAEHIVLAATEDPRCRQYVQRLLRERWNYAQVAETEIQRFAGECQNSSLVAVAVHHGNFPTLEYMGATLADSGHRLSAIYFQGEAPEAGPLHATSCRGSLARLAVLLRALPAQPIYVQAHGRWSFLSQFVSAVAPQLRIIQEVWDWMDAFVDPAQEASFIADGVFTASEIALMRFSEGWLRANVAAFVHKHGGEELDQVVQGAVARELRIVPCPPRTWMRPPVHVPGPPWKLVHTGQIKASDTSRRAFGDLHILPLIRSLTAQGIEFTAYTSALGSGQSLATSLAEYVGESANNPRFSLHPRIDVRELVTALNGRHHFGSLLYCFDPDLAVGPRHLATALASKLFIYIAAGLPVLVSPELRYMAEFVGSNGIGMVVERAQLTELNNLIAAADYDTMVSHVVTAQQRFGAEDWVREILQLAHGDDR